jgi:hypothetical protein
MINSAWVLNQLSLTLGDPYAQHYISGGWRLLQRQVSEDKCMRCEGEDMNQYVGQKYRVIGHILKTHLTEKGHLLCWRKENRIHKLKYHHQYMSYRF